MPTRRQIAARAGSRFSVSNARLAKNGLCLTVQGNWKAELEPIICGIVHVNETQRNAHEFGFKRKELLKTASPLTVKTSFSWAPAVQTKENKL